ncbi:MAG TPA: hypothetical protein VGN20_26135 [Mucilaginibacter sp.]|jgi:hypothetical protein
MASGTGRQVHYAPGILNVDQSNDEIGDQSISQPFLLHQSSELAKPVKSFLKNYANLNAAHVILNISAVSYYAYGKYNNHFKALNKLLLFPFHGFW